MNEGERRSFSPSEQLETCPEQKEYGSGLRNRYGEGEGSLEVRRNG